MSRRKPARKWAVLGGLLCAAFMGCSPSTLWFLFKGDEKAPAKYELAAKDGQKELSVLVMVTPPPTAGVDLAGVDREIALLVGRRLAEETKESKHPVKAIDPAKLDKIKASAGTDWRTLSPAAIGKKLGADYVIDVSLGRMAMMPADLGGEYYKGSASYDVTVYDTANPDAPYRQYSHKSEAEMVGKESMTAVAYRRKLLEQVAQDIAFYHVPHTPDRTADRLR